jgi:hypothetical protein
VRVPVQDVERAGHLDQAGLRAAPLAVRVVVRRSARGQVGHEHLGQPVRDPVEQLGQVVLGPVQPGGRDERDAGGPRQPRQVRGPPVQPERRPLDHRPPAGCGERAQFGLGRPEVVQLLPGQLPGGEEQVVVRVGDPERGRVDVAEHRPYQRFPGHVRQPSRQAVSSFRIGTAPRARRLHSRG